MEAVASEIDVLEDLTDESEAARLLHQTPRTLAVWRCDGKGPRFVKLGRRVFYRRSDLRAFILAQTVQPSPAEEAPAPKLQRRGKGARS